MLNVRPYHGEPQIPNYLGVQDQLAVHFNEESRGTNAECTVDLLEQNRGHRPAHSETTLQGGNHTTRPYMWSRGSRKVKSTGCSLTMLTTMAFLGTRFWVVLSATDVFDFMWIIVLNARKQR